MEQTDESCSYSESDQDNTEESWESSESIRPKYTLKCYPSGTPVIFETHNGTVIDAIYRKTQGNGTRIVVDSVSEFPSKTRSSDGRPMYYSAYEIKYFHLFCREADIDANYKYADTNSAFPGISYEHYLSLKDVIWDHKYIPVYDCNFQSTLQEIRACDVVGIVAMGSHTDKVRFAQITFFIVATRDKVYLFDIKFTPKSFWEMGLKNILEDTKIQKVVYDSKTVADLLFNRYWKIKLNNVFDVMIADYDICDRKIGAYSRSDFRRCPELMEQYLRLPQGMFQNSELLTNGITHNSRPASTEMRRNVAISAAFLIPLYNVQKTILLRNFYMTSQLYCDLLACRSDKCREEKIKELNCGLPQEIGKFLEEDCE